MTRVKRGVTSHARHKKTLKQVKGQYGRRKNTIRIAKQALEKAMQYAYRDRRKKKSLHKFLAPTTNDQETFAHNSLFEHFLSLR